MKPPRAVVFDLGGTLINWPDWDGGAPAKWSAAYDAIAGNERPLPARDPFVAAMRAAEKAHWERVDTSDLPHSKPHASVFAEIAGRLDVLASECVMVGDRQIDDVSGAKAAGMRGIWRRNDSGFPTSDVTPDATVDQLSELPDLL